MKMTSTILGIAMTLSWASAFAESAQVDCTHSLSGSTISLKLDDLSDVNRSTVHIYGNGNRFETKDLRSEHSPEGLEVFTVISGVDFEYRFFNLGSKACLGGPNEFNEPAFVEFWGWETMINRNTCRCQTN